MAHNTAVLAEEDVVDSCRCAAAAWESCHLDLRPEVQEHSSAARLDLPADSPGGFHAAGVCSQGFAPLHETADVMETPDPGTSGVDCRCCSM